jgi:hypothetical protein
MSSLDHNLVCANSLTGIGSVEEALDVLVPGRKGKMTLFDQPIEDALESAKTVLVDAALLAETNKEESRAASRAAKKALREAEQARLLFDAAVLTRIGRADLVAGSDPVAIAKMAAQPHAQQEIELLSSAHMPVLFPEVFLRENPGFDVLLGNPPWDKVETDRRLFVMRHYPGALNGMSQGEKDKFVEKKLQTNSGLASLFNVEQEKNDLVRRALVAGPYPGMGTDHPDYAKAFAWRNFDLLRKGGLFGVVLPRIVLSGRALEKWRQTVMGKDASVDFWLLSNLGGYVFPHVDPRKEFVLCVGGRGGTGLHRLCGPLRSRGDWDNSRQELADIDTRFLGEQHEIPNITSGIGLNVLETMFNSERFIDSSLFLKSVYETDQTKNKSDFVLNRMDDVSLVPVYKGESFDLWTPRTGKIFARADLRKIEKVLLEKAETGRRRASSAFFGQVISADTLPLKRARIAYRWTTNPTNSRTLIISLIPPDTVLTNGTPYLLSRIGNETREAFVLGVFSSLVFDWMVRAYVEGTMRQGILNRLPVPAFDENEAISRRTVEAAARLAAQDSSFDSWANAVGVPVGSISSEDEKFALVAELDALVARQYGLSRAQVEHVFKTFHRGWDYGPRLTKVLEYFDRIAGDE